MSSAYDWLLQFPLPWKDDAPAEAPAPEPPPLRDDLARLRESLDESLRHRITSAAELQRGHSHQRREALPTTVAPLDRILDGGLARGELTEISGTRSSGRFSTVLAALAAVTSSGEPAVLIDHGDHFDPEHAAAAGVELDRLLWIRPPSVRDAVHAAELVIATGFPLVVVELGVQLRGRRVADASWVRLARAAASYGCALFVSTPFHLTATAPEAVVKSSHGKALWKGVGRSPRILTGVESELVVEKHRRHRPGAKEMLRLAASEAVETRDEEETRGSRLEARGSERERRAARDEEETRDSRLEPRVSRASSLESRASS